MKNFGHELQKDNHFIHKELSLSLRGESAIAIFSMLNNYGDFSPIPKISNCDQQTQRTMVTTNLNPLKIPAYLNLVNAIKNPPRQNTWTFYDAEADILYVNYNQLALVADDSEVTENGILIRYQNDEIIGLTILTFTKQLESCF